MTPVWADAIPVADRQNRPFAMSLLRAQNSYAEPRGPSRLLFHNVKLWLGSLSFKAATEIEDEPNYCQNELSTYLCLSIKCHNLKNLPETHHYVPCDTFRSLRACRSSQWQAFFLLCINALQACARSSR